MTEPHPLKLAFAREYPGELAAFLGVQRTDAVVRALEGMPPDTAAAVVAMLPRGLAIRVLTGRDDEIVSRWLNAATLNHALSLLLLVDANRRTRVLEGLPNRRVRRTLERLLIYPPETVGALVDPSAMHLNAAMPLGDAVAVLQADEHAMDQSVWLVDDDGIYQGLLDSGRALVARSQSLEIREFLVPVRPLRAETALDAARDFAEWEKHTELPVTDEQDHLLGALSRSRLMAESGATGGSGEGLAESMGELAREYFRIMGICLGDLFGGGGRKR